MKVCIIQPAYSTDYSRSDEHFEKELALLAQCDESMDLIVLPEMCDIPCLAPTKELADASSHKYLDTLLETVSKTAKRCNAMIFVSARSKTEGGERNSTYAFNRQGEIAGIYHKQHLTPGEVNKIKLDSDYSFEFSEPTVVEMEGLRFGFLTCYDFYFYEMFANMARQNLDIVIGCSHQRSDTHLALQIFTQNLAYNTNTYVLRSSVSMGEDSPTGGASMVVAPTGEVLANLYSKVGMATVDIDPKAKYFKPAGFGNPPSAHYEYIEKGRRPWKYRPGGSAIVRHDEIMPYPRACAHRGFHGLLPENSLPAFGAAVAMGAPEIEFDIWYTKDGVPVSIHDHVLDRVSNGKGKIRDYTLNELRELDFGSVKSETLEGLKIPTLEEILAKLSSHTVMNIHLKTMGEKPEYLAEVIRLVRKYDCEKYVYFMSGDDELLARLQKEYPEFTRCCGAGDHPWEIVDRAIKYGCKKVQLYKPYFNQEMIDKAHANGIICNVFWSNKEEETEQFLDMGIDTILTNNYHNISKIVKKRKQYRLF
jgi:glycerophosphoryl diester phosphodiesterase/predicted amidohydrolase